MDDGYSLLLDFSLSLKMPKVKKKKKERKKWSLKMRKKWRRWGVEDQIRDYGKKQFRWERSWRPELGSKKMGERVNGVQRRSDWLDRGLRKREESLVSGLPVHGGNAIHRARKLQRNSWFGEQGVTFILDMQAVECHIWPCWLLFMSFWLYVFRRHSLYFSPIRYLFSIFS